MDRPGTEHLASLAARHRETLIEITHSTGGAYLAQALSSIDLMTALLHGYVRCRPSDPLWTGRDRFLLSPGHYALPLYVCLADLGYFDAKMLGSFKQNGSPVELATHRGTLPGIEVSGGSLAQALSVGVGMALAARVKGEAHRVFLLMSDGEQGSGQIWEAAASAAHFGLGNLLAVIDKNGFQVDGATRDVMDMEPLVEKYRSFGWVVEQCDGNDMSAVTASLDRLAGATEQRPRILVGATVRGKGLAFMEANPAFHFTRMDDAMRDTARAQLEAGWDDA
jgi:transketolase